MEDVRNDRLMSEDDIQKVSEGFLAVYSEPLSKVSSNLNELTTKQGALVDSISLYNQRLNTTQNNEVIKAMFADMTYCREQLVQIKKQMLSLHDRSSKLKIRAIKIMNHAKNKRLAQLEALEREQQLIGGGNKKQ